MKSFRLEFQKGINIVGDKAVIEPGFLTVADNADLRSGMPRAFRGPEFLQSVPITTTRAFEYRGRWYYSQRWRDYQTEYINGRDRVYFTESGEAALTATLALPSKIIDGKQAILGTRKPQSSPFVATTDVLTPIVTAVVTTPGGNYTKNQTTSFRLAARTVDGIQTPSPPKFNQINTDSSYVTYTWHKIKGAIGYVVFVGNLQGQEQKVTELGSAALSYTDTGIIQGGGELASNYDVKNPFTYIYTFLRDVSTIENESGPSDLSPTVETSKTRKISFDVLNDGFFTDTNTQSATAGQITLTSSPTYAGTLTINAFHYNPAKVQVQVVTTTAHGLNTGDPAYFSGTGTSTWDGQIFDIIADTTSPTALYVKGILPPSGSSGFIVPAKTRVTLSPPLALPTQDGDAVYLYVNNTTDPTRLFAATASTVNAFDVNAYTAVGATATMLQYLPGNGNILYRNLYRIGDTDQYSLVAQVPVTQDSYLDGATFDFIIGTPPDSYYVEDRKTIIYDVPPPGMVALTSHYGMMFGIDGHTVRWTPTGRPDAWPQIFAIAFPYKPVALASWGQSLIVLCQDAIYRLDGNIPTQMSLSKTQAENGCIAPHSVQKTHAGLVYLSKRGIMLFNGSTADCLTDSRIPGPFFQGPSSLLTPINYWWHPTLIGYNYANLAMQDNIVGVDKDAYRLEGTHAIDGPDFAARSFYHLGKYFLYWTKDNNYQAHTCVIIDLQAQGLPVTTMGMKLLDSHVNDVGEAFVLAEDTKTGDLMAPSNNYLVFKDYQSQMGVDVAFTTSGTVTRDLFHFAVNGDYSVPYHIRTGDNSLGSPLIKKKFRDVRFHALEDKGTLHVRVYIDGRYICDGQSTVATNPNRERQVNIPINKCMGYSIDVEFSGDVPLRGLVITYDLLDGTTSN